MVFGLFLKYFSVNTSKCFFVLSVDTTCFVFGVFLCDTFLPFLRYVFDTNLRTFRRWYVVHVGQFGILKPGKHCPRWSGVYMYIL